MRPAAAAALSLPVFVVTAVHFPFYWAVGRINEIAAWLVLGITVYSAAAYGRRPQSSQPTSSMPPGRTSKLGLFNRRPAEAVEAISAVEQASRQAIADLHQLVGVLRRQDEADDDLAPQPGLRQLPTLVAQMSRAGLATQLTIHGDPQKLPAATTASVCMRCLAVMARDGEAEDGQCSQRGGVAAARCGADGHPDARHRRAGGLPPDSQRRNQHGTRADPHHPSSATSTCSTRCVQAPAAFC